MLPKTLKRCLAALATTLILAPATRAQNLQTSFATPPDSVRTSAYWYWISGNISKEGVIKDLQAMKKAGINRAYIGNVGMGDMPQGKVKILSPEWWDIIHTALKTATQLNIEIGMFNSPGWSGAGGPWVKPDQAMRYLAASKTIAHGPSTFNARLSAPADSFRDVKVIAYPAPKQYEDNIGSRNPAIRSTVQDAHNAIDGNETTEMHLPEEKKGDSITIDLTAKESYTARSLTILPGKRTMHISGYIGIETNGQYQPIADFNLDRSNDALNVGFDPYGPLTICLPATTAKSFRIVITHWTTGSTIKELKLSASPVVASYVVKTFGKMHPNPHPFWEAYQWPVQPKVDDTNLVINADNVIDISEKMDKQGTLHWNVPKGDWIILRTWMTPTKVLNSPAPPEATGLQGDKMSKERIAENFDAFIGQVLKRIPEEDRKSFKIIVEDSYEVGGQNWTDDMIQSFKQRYGYDPTPYIPVMMGQVVGSEDKSDRFLWDLRRFVADRVAYDYVGGLKEASHKHGLTTWLENYGHWGFPGEFLQYGGQSDEIGGEFWTEGDLGDIENRSASSSAHIYGKNKVYAESFTAGGGVYARYPAMLKQRGDRFFTEGINSTLLHVMITQPDDQLPGINAWFGTEFNRHNTWFDQLDVFTNYLKRSNFMLQQGRYVADVAYFIGEDAPKMTGVRDPELPKGYSYDYINAEVIEKRLTIRDGRWTLPDGLSYKVLILPQLKTMRPELLKRLYELVSQGGVLMGPAPERSPSLENYGSADAEVKKLAAAMWTATDSWHRVGKGIVITGNDLQSVLNKLNIPPDFRTADKDNILFLHRTTGTEDIYYISNQDGSKIDIEPSFRITGKTPELWDPLLGRSRDLTSYTEEKGTTKIPLELERYGSYFIVFKKASTPIKINQSNFPEPTLVAELKTPWSVQFDPTKRGPVTPVTFNTLTDWTTAQDTAIKYYSGTAIYKNTFRLRQIPVEKTLYLELGVVSVMAKVKINGKYVGGVWTPPYRVDISEAVKKGTNDVEIEVVNTWVNRIIGDSRLAEAQRKTWMNVNPYKPDSPLRSSGLLGPVRIISAP